jgi:hypothetical protein
MTLKQQGAMASKQCSNSNKNNDDGSRTMQYQQGMMRFG